MLSTSWDDNFIPVTCEDSDRGVVISARASGAFLGLVDRCLFLIFRVMRRGWMLRAKNAHMRSEAFGKSPGELTRR